MLKIITVFCHYLESSGTDLVSMDHSVFLRAIVLLNKQFVLSKMSRSTTGNIFIKMNLHLIFLKPVSSVH